MAVRAHATPRLTLPSMTDSGHLASPVSDGESDWQAQATLSLLVFLHHVGRRRRRRQRIPPIIPPIQSIAFGQGRGGQNVAAVATAVVVVVAIAVDVDPDADDAVDVDKRCYWC